MKSILTNEPASQQDILIMEESDQIDWPDKTSTILHTGARFPYCPPWKQKRTTEVTGTAFWIDTLTNSIASRVQKKFSAIGGIERIYIRRDIDIYRRRDIDFYRVWMVIPDMDRDLEDQIYAAELAFMDAFPDILFDFTVIFRQGKDPASIHPSGASLIYTSK